MTTSPLFAVEPVPRPRRPRSARDVVAERMRVGTWTLERAEVRRRCERLAVSPYAPTPARRRALAWLALDREQVAA